MTHFAKEAQKSLGWAFFLGFVEVYFKCDLSN